MLLLLPAMAGLMLAACFPGAGQGWLAWVAWVPLILYVAQCRDRRRACAGGGLAGAIAFGILLRWIPETLGRYGGLSPALAWIAYGLMIALLACYPACVCALIKHLLRRWHAPMLLLFPAAWIVMEYAQTFTPLGGLPWLLAGYTQTRFPAMLQIADIAGIYGVSFLVLSVNAGAAWLVHSRRRPWSAWAPLLAAAALTAGAWFYGTSALRRWDAVQPRYRVAMLQGNLHYEEPQSVLAEKFQQGYVRMADALPPGAADLLLLPESPAPTFFQSDSGYRQSMERLAQRFALGLVLSNINYREADGHMRYFNSAFFLDRRGALTGIYDKMHLVPFGEYIPWERLLFFAETITKDMGSFYPGRDYRIVGMGPHPVHAVICFEAAFPQLVRRFAGRGSRLIINLTNDGWYGLSAAPLQHLAIARVRAIENRRYLLRAANSGISAVITPAGTLQGATGLMQEAVCRGRFDFLAETTFYARYGDLLVFLCAIMCAGAIGVGECRRWGALRALMRRGLR